MSLGVNLWQVYGAVSRDNKNVPPGFIIIII